MRLGSGLFGSRMSPQRHNEVDGWGILCLIVVPLWLLKSFGQATPFVETQGRATRSDLQRALFALERGEGFVRDVFWAEDEEQHRRHQDDQPRDQWGAVAPFAAGQPRDDQESR